MKKTALVVVFSIIFLCVVFGDSSRNEGSGINDKDWESGYEYGYDEGYEDGYDNGHEEGRFEGWEDYRFENDSIDDIVCEARLSVSTENIDPLEAHYIIECYRNNRPYYDNGSPPTWQDYNEAIDVALEYILYFEDARYK